MQWMRGQRPTERHASLRIVAREGNRATHAAHGRDGVVHTRDVDQRRDLADAVAGAAREQGRGAVERQLRRWQSTSTELVLQPVDANATQHSVLVAELYQEDAQPPSTFGSS